MFPWGGEGRWQGSTWTNPSCSATFWSDKWMAADSYCSTSDGSHRQPDTQQQQQQPGSCSAEIKLLHNVAEELFVFTWPFIGTWPGLEGRSMKNMPMYVQGAKKAELCLLSRCSQRSQCTEISVPNSFKHWSSFCPFPTLGTGGLNRRVVWAAVFIT